MFKLQYGLHMVHVWKETDYKLNDFPLVVLTSDMLCNPKEISYHYLSRNHTGTWDPEICYKIMNIAVGGILKSRL